MFSSAGSWQDHDCFTVIHCHGRKTRGDGSRLMRSHMIGCGALYATYLFRDPDLCRPIYWDCKDAVRQIAGGGNLCLPAIGFSARDKLACYVRGAARHIRHGRSDAAA